ncbi:hypothetical protein SAMN05216191_107203 [Paenibacillus jilunlii]|uniref:Uncharacterized protein n=1 Tax=Paenibacillus jilunlii TaxID=682956 RepID=A0A1G9PIC2_9BACL|nr:hypothetical protein SAMN05216191_107203 [Paenibacillus jilunlii]
MEPFSEENGYSVHYRDSIAVFIYGPGCLGTPESAIRGETLLLPSRALDTHCCITCNTPSTFAWFGHTLLYKAVPVLPRSIGGKPKWKK